MSATQPPQPHLAQLLAGIVSDFAKLVEHQLTLVRLELKEDIDVARRGTIQLAIALGIELIAAVLASFSLVYLAATLFPAAPLWVCFAVVAVLAAAAGGIVLAVALRKLRNLKPLNDSIETMEETIRWQTDPR